MLLMLNDAIKHLQKIKKSVKQSKTIAQQPKTLKPTHCWHKISYIYIYKKNLQHKYIVKEKI